MPKHGPNVWVVVKDGHFTIKEEGRSSSLIVPTVSQRAAIRIARLIAKANRSELIIQGRDGRIRARDSHGFDAFPPRG